MNEICDNCDPSFTCWTKPETCRKKPARSKLAAVAGSAVVWVKGPAEGGHGTAGTADDGTSLWYDGEQLIIIVETMSGREIAVVNISCDEHFFDAKDASSGDSYDAWGPDCWSWWAKLDATNLPPPPQCSSLPRCPHCGSGLLWSEDRGAHCDGCEDFDPETDLPNNSAQIGPEKTNP